MFRYCPLDGREYQHDEVLCPQCGEPRFKLTNAMPPRKSKKNCWKKILYEKQPFDDNHVDETFLDSLITNANVKSYDYWRLCRDTISITQHLSFIAIFLVVWKLINRGALHYKYLIIFDMLMLPLGYLLRIILRPNVLNVWSSLKSAVVVFGCLWILCPVLQTLTQTFSDGSVFALTTIFLIIHIALYDYPYIYRNPDEVDDRLSSSLALNAAMFTSVLLASRLDTLHEVFAFLFFGIEVFALSPILRRYIWQKSPKANIFFVMPALFATASFFLCTIASVVVFLYVLSLVFITFLAPLWLIRSQKYKNEIKGPWDIAHVRTYA